MITALLVSVNYSDYLELVLPYNSLRFDQIIILTIESDKVCQDVCSRYSNVKCLVFSDEILKTNGKQFNKGAILNKGLEYLNDIGYSDWLVLTDSDIIFPENFKELLISREKVPNILYGMTRRHCKNVQCLKRYTRTKDKNILFSRAREPAFVGYCQTFIYQANKYKFVEFSDAEQSDIKFIKYFDAGFKRFPDLFEPDLFEKCPNLVLLSDTDFVIHLGQPGRNWKGRTSPKFI